MYLLKLALHSNNIHQTLSLVLSVKIPSAVGSHGVALLYWRLRYTAKCFESTLLFLLTHAPHKAVFGKVLALGQRKEKRGMSSHVVPRLGLTPRITHRDQLEAALDEDVARVRFLQSPHEVFVMKLQGDVPHEIGNKRSRVKTYTETARLKLWPLQPGEETGLAIIDLEFMVHSYKHTSTTPTIVEGRWAPAEHPTAGVGPGSRFARMIWPQKVGWSCVRKKYRKAMKDGSLDPIDLDTIALHEWTMKNKEGRGLFGRPLTAR